MTNPIRSLASCILELRHDLWKVERTLEIATSPYTIGKDEDYTLVKGYFHSGDYCYNLRLCTGSENHFYEPTENGNDTCFLKSLPKDVSSYHPASEYYPQTNTLADCIIDLRNGLISLDAQNALDAAISPYAISKHDSDVSVKGHFYSNDYCNSLKSCVDAESFLYDPITGNEGKGVCVLGGEINNQDSSENSQQP